MGIGTGAGTNLGSMGATVGIGAATGTNLASSRDINQALGADYAIDQVGVAVGADDGVKTILGANHDIN